LPRRRRDQQTTETGSGRPCPEPRGEPSLVIIYATDKTAQGWRQPLGQGPVRIGRLEDNDIALDDDTVSRRHARLEKRGDGWVIMDTGSRNGTLVNDGEITGVVTLARGGRVQIGTTVFKYLSGRDVETDFYEEIYQLSITDNLTQVGNRRYLEDSLEHELSRARRFERPLSVLLLDIDFFKRVNDEHGHLVGDAVLRNVAQIVRGRVRHYDTVARYGGEEFAVVMPETGLSDAAHVAGELGKAIARSVVEYRSARVSVTVSVGCAEMQDHDDDAASVLARADERLYAAKHAGRNRVMT
jgi:diguanylate cyclase (GGDEF)-like protein